MGQPRRGGNHHCVVHSVPVVPFTDQDSARGGQRIDLTLKEYALLEYLMRHTGRVLTRPMISEHVWNQDFDTFTNVIDVYVNYLRNKIDRGRTKKLIHTIRGSGYMLKAD